MQYFIEINLDNAAFEDKPGLEVSRILHELAERVEGYSFNNPNTTFPVRDINGNRCGSHGYKSDLDAEPYDRDGYGPGSDGW
jgi:hypothetical protein